MNKDKSLCFVFFLQVKGDCGEGSWRRWKDLVIIRDKLRGGKFSDLGDRWFYSFWTSGFLEKISIPFPLATELKK
jgi:hypothetical protein